MNEDLDPELLSIIIDDLEDIERRDRHVREMVQIVSEDIERRLNGPRPLIDKYLSFREADRLRETFRMQCALEDGITILSRYLERKFGDD